MLSLPLQRVFEGQQPAQVCAFEGDDIVIGLVAADHQGLATRLQIRGAGAPGSGRRSQEYRTAPVEFRFSGRAGKTRRGKAMAPDWIRLFSEPGDIRSDSPLSPE